MNKTSEYITELKGLLSQGWGPNTEAAFQAGIDALSVTPAPEPQPKVAAPAKLDSGELWEFFFGKLKGYVPDELTDDLFEELADHLNAHYLATPPVVEEAVKADDGKVLIAPYDRIMVEGEGDTVEYQLVPTSMLETYREVIETLKARSTTP